MLRSDSSPRQTVQLSHGVSVASRVKWRSVLLAGASATALLQSVHRGRNRRSGIDMQAFEITSIANYVLW